MIDYIKSLEEYNSKFHDLIDESDKESLNFSGTSSTFHESFYKFQDKPVMCTVGESGNITAVLFYNITVRDRYITILNIVTPVKYRQRGYAKKLIAEAVKQAYAAGKTRIRMNCDDLPGTMAFYNKLGLVYWGKTKPDAYYVNLPLLSGDIEDFKKYGTIDLTQTVDERVINLANLRMSVENSEKELLNNKYPDSYKYELFKELQGWYKNANIR